MKRLLFPFLMILSGCQTYPDEPSRVVTVEGNYVAIADCTYIGIESEGAWRREELPSLKTVRLQRGDDKYITARIEFTEVEQTKVKATIRVMSTIKGSSYYPDKFEKIIRGCQRD